MRLALASPSLLSLMLIAVVTAPVSSIPRNAPVVACQDMPRTRLLLRLAVAATAELMIPSLLPVLLLVPFSTLLFVMLRVPVPPVLLMPWKIPAPDPRTEQFWTVLFVIAIVPVAALRIPARVVTAVVVPEIPTWIELAAVVLPIVFPLIVTLPFVPFVSIPRTTNPIV